MAKKPHGLLLMFEGLPATVIQSQVLARVNWLETHDVATFDVLSLAHSSTLYRESLKRLAALDPDVSRKITLGAGTKPALPGSRALNRRRVSRHLEAAKARYDFIHARGDYAAAVAGPLARRLGTPMLWDCRGDAEAEFVERWGERKGAGPLIAWRAAECLKDGRMAARASSVASFVSKPLRDKWREALAGKPSFVIPCTGDESLFYFDPALRARVRGQLGYGDGDIVFVYSGSLGPYQGFDLLADWFARIRRSIPSARLLVVTPAPAAARAGLTGIEETRLHVTSARFSDVNGYLNAADYGFMLRPVSRTNEAAFPTKFAEYGLAGLRIVVGPSVPDCYEFASEANCLVPADASAGTFSPSTERRAEIMAHFIKHLTHAGVGAEMRKLYGDILGGR